MSVISIDGKSLAWLRARALPKEPKAKAFILSSDGGGARGIVPARFVERLTHLAPSLLHGTSIFTGTSTGGLLALGYAAGLGPERMRRLYQENVGAIFKRRPFGGLWGARYSADGLRRIVQETFGDKRVGELERFILVPAYDLDYPATRPRSGRAKFFKSFADDDVRVKDVALATTAAPTYFPAHAGYVDGGIVANNPATCALAQALEWGWAPEQVHILSIGTGRSPSWIAGQDNDWGSLRWAPKLPGLMIDAVAGVAEYQLRQVLGERAHHRLEVELPRDIALDDVNALDELVALADRVDLAPTLRWLEEAGWA